MKLFIRKIISVPIKKNVLAINDAPNWNGQTPRIHSSVFPITRKVQGQVEQSPEKDASEQTFCIRIRLINDIVKVNIRLPSEHINIYCLPSTRFCGKHLLDINSFKLYKF